MTVSYGGDVGNASCFGAFSRILIRWRGSVYKLVYKASTVHTVNSMQTVLSEMAHLLPACP